MKERKREGSEGGETEIKKRTKKDKQTDSKKWGSSKEERERSVRHTDK